MTTGAEMKESSKSQVGWAWITMWLLGSFFVSIPLWTPIRLPLVDWPQHTAMVSILAFPDDAERGFSLYYEIVPQLSTYLTFYLGGAFLGKIFGIDTALRLLINLYIIGTPLSLAYLLRVFRSSPWPALLSLSIVWNWPLYFGFGAYVLSIPLSFWTFAALLQVVNQGEIKRYQFLEILVASTILFFTHALMFGITLAISAVIIMVFQSKSLWRLRKQLFFSLLPSVICFCIWFFSIFLVDQTDRLGASMVSLHAQSVDKTRWLPFSVVLRRFGSLVAHNFTDGSDRSILLGYAFVSLWLVFIGKKKQNYPPPRRLARQRFVLFLALVSIYWCTPSRFANVAFVSDRLAILGVFAALLVIPSSSGGSQRRNLLFHLPILLLVAWCGWLHHIKFNTVNADAKDFSTVLAEASPRKRLYGLIYDEYASELVLPVYLHWPAYYMHDQGGLVGYTFVKDTTFRLALRVRGSTPYPGTNGEWHPERMRYGLYADFYDYFLVRTTSNANHNFGGRKHLRLVSQSGLWSLWENTRPPKKLLYSFRDSIHHATIKEKDGAECAAWNGVRFDCPLLADNSWVGPKEGVLGGVSLQCTSSTPLPNGRILEISFDELPLEGEVIAGFIGVFDTDFTESVSVNFSAMVDENEIGTLEVGAKQGFSTFDWTILPDFERTVTFRISSSSPSPPELCWGASLFEKQSRPNTGQPN